MFANKVMHVDVNNAYLSWEAVHRLKICSSVVDLRNVPSAVGGNPKDRRGIVLAKSEFAKKAGIKTGETLYSAFQKCPSLKVVSPNFELYSKYSRRLIRLLEEFSPNVNRFSIDECFLEFTDDKNLSTSRADIADLAKRIGDRVKGELGFTVSIGIGDNRLLAKMASDLKKPDAVSTIFIDDIPYKMWNLPVSHLFTVGRSTLKKISSFGIETIGDLANTDKQFLISKFGKHGETIFNYANGIHIPHIGTHNSLEMKSIGNSLTLPADTCDKSQALLYLLALTEKVSIRLRNAGKSTSCICVTIKTSEFISYSHQRKMKFLTDSTEIIFKEVKSLFEEMWTGEYIRLLGVRVSKPESPKEIQISFFDSSNNFNDKSADAIIDSIRSKYGTSSILRASFLNSGIRL